jgi:tape measure domain-containing protein
MPTNVEALVLQMSADMSRMEKAMAKISGQTDRKLREIENRFDKMNRHIRRSGDQINEDMRRSIAAIGTGLAVRGLVDAADQWTNLRNSVKLYADTVGPVDQATSRLVTVANDAGVAVDTLGQTFSASARAAGTLGASSDQVFAFTEAVAKGSSIANNGVAGVNAALGQLGQALGNPIVQMGEFNSIMDGTPRLAQAFADGIDAAGGSVAKLRTLIQQGQISNADLFKGLLSQLPKLRDEFSTTEATVGRSMARLQNAWVQYVGGANQASGATQTLSKFIDFVANNFDRLADAAIVAATVFGGTLAAGAIVRLVKALAVLGSGMATTAGRAVALRTAMAFFGGPVGAAVIALGAAMAVFASSSSQADTAVADLTATLADAQRIQDDLKKDTERLAELNRILTVDMEKQSEAALKTAEAERRAVSERIRGNQALLIDRKATAQAQLAVLQSDKAQYEQLERVAQRVRQRFPDAPQMPRMDLLRYGRQTFIDYMNAPGGYLSNNQFAADPRGNDRGILNDINEVMKKADEAQALVDQVAELDAALQALNVDGPPDVDGLLAQLANPSTAGGIANATDAVRGFRTELEQLQDLARAQRQAAAADASRRTALNLQVGAVGDKPDLSADQRQEYYDRFDAATAQLAQNAEVRSRILVQGMRDYIDATGDAYGAIKLLAETQGVDLASTPRGSNMLDWIKAAGDGLLKLDDIIAHVEPKITALGEIQVITPELPDFEAPDAVDPALQRDFDGHMRRSGDELETYLSEQTEARDRIRDAVRDGFKMGIETGDWDQALRSVLAEAVTSGLDQSLTKLADALINLFSQMGSNNSQQGWASAIAGLFSYGGARAGGGPVSGGHIYRVNENGQEFLALGQGMNGQVFNSGQMNKMMAAVRPAAGGAFVTNITFSGDIDASTLPQVAQMLQAHESRMMARLPSAVDQRVAYGKKNRIPPYR